VGRRPRGGAIVDDRCGSIAAAVSMVEPVPGPRAPDKALQSTRNMHRSVRSWGVAGTLAISMLGACAAISGLGTYSTGDCAGECDASIEASSSGGDGSSDSGKDVGQDVGQDQASGAEFDGPGEAETTSGDAEDANESADASERMDSGALDAEEAVDSALDTGVADSGEAPDVGSAQDSGGAPDTGLADSGEIPDANDSGCGVTSTVENCSACGIACTTSTGTPTCNGATCSYTCNSTRQDCNRATAPDTDGCECTGTACCGTACQTAHNSGLTSPTNYYACSPTGNMTQAEALAACTGTGGTGCTAKNTTCGGIFGFGGTSTSAACGTVAGTCYCWVYSGQNSGQVHAGGSGCTIACSSGSAWN